MVVVGKVPSDAPKRVKKSPYYAGSCIHTRPRFFRRFHKGFLHFAYIFKRNSGYFDEISVMGVPESQEISFDTECRQHVSESMCKACVSHQACSCQKKLSYKPFISSPPDFQAKNCSRHPDLACKSDQMGFKVIRLGVSGLPTVAKVIDSGA